MARLFPQRCPPQARRLLLATLATLCAGLSGQGSMAASVQETADLLQRPPGAATGSKTLDRALEVDTNTGQRNLDLLLDTRNAGEAPGDLGAVPARRATALAPPAQTAQQPQQPQLSQPAAATTAVGPVPLSGAAAPAGTAAQREWLGTLPGAGNPGPSTMPGVDLAMGGDPGQSRGGRESASQLDPDVRNVIREAMAFVREHRHWLLGTLAAVAVVAAGVQAWLRRTGDAPQRRAERLAQQSARRSERRTRRRSTRA